MSDDFQARGMPGDTACLLCSGGPTPCICRCHFASYVELHPPDTDLRDWAAGQPFPHLLHMPVADVTRCAICGQPWPCPTRREEERAADKEDGDGTN